VETGLMPRPKSGVLTPPDGFRSVVLIRGIWYTHPIVRRAVGTAILGQIP
jgi:hypothetical protein